MRILIVDDDMIIRNLLRKVFIRNGYEIAGEAVNGKEAVEKYRETQPDFVFMDNSMPRMTGLEALRKILAEFPDAKIIICSADEIGDEALQIGAIAYFPKSINTTALLSFLRKYTSPL